MSSQLETRPSSQKAVSPGPRSARQAATPQSPDDRFFRRMVNGMRNGVIAIHRDGLLALMNDEAYRIFSLRPQPDDLGRPFSEVFCDRPEVARVLACAFELTTLPNRAELRLRDLNRVIGYTLSQVRDDDGGPVGAMLFFKDLTLVEQQEERERLRDRLASLGEMAAGIAHELKNPLAGIEVNAGLLRRQLPDSPAAQALVGDIISEAKLANAIVVEMLEFVRPIRLQLERTALDIVLREAVLMAESSTPRGDVSVTMEIQADLPMVDGDDQQLSQVFVNLMTNAFEALDGKGRIVVRATAEALESDPGFTSETPTPTQVVVIEVCDNGPGVAADLNDRIFDPFFTTKPKGSGLGLPIVRKIVDAHDGRIDLVCVAGQGTTFRVTLPVSSSATWFK